MGIFKDLIKSNEAEIKKGAIKVFLYAVKTFVVTDSFIKDPVYRKKVDKERAEIWNRNR
ncbi:MAG: hypothetical protein P4L45_13640 [Ignavibacteriaceae bacterium]|nr:hypothetical protein [Ignavibacteriaceae bacterium]